MVFMTTTHDHPLGPVVVSPTTAARMLDCTRAHVHQLMERGELRRLNVKGSRAVRVPIADVYALVGLDAPSMGGAA